jgi:SAM-dependent methyltransferase
VPSAKDLIRQRYTGQDGASYHASVHVKDQFVLNVLAKSRSRKFQPLVKPNDTVLEFGAGLGVNLLNLRCQQRVAFDASDAGCEICATAGVEFTTDIEELQSEQFSVVICHHVLEHVPDPIQVLEQIGALLAPNGRMILCVPFETTRRHRQFRPDDADHHLFAWNVQTLGNLVTSVGFTIERIGHRAFGFEQRLAFLAKYGQPFYQMGLWVVRIPFPIEEILLVAQKPQAC